MRFEKKPNRAYWRFAWLPVECPWCKANVWLEDVRTTRSAFWHRPGGIGLDPVAYAHLVTREQCRRCFEEDPKSLERACSSEPLMGKRKIPAVQPLPELSPETEEMLRRLDDTPPAPAKEMGGTR